MSLTTYAELQTAMTSWLGQSINSASYPDMIALFEAAVNRRLRVRQQETQTTLTTVSGSVTLPTDYLHWRRVTWAGSSRVELVYEHPSILQADYPTTPSDIPRVFTIEGTTLKIRPVDDTASIFEFLYFAKVPALSGTVNWLYAAHPDVYLFGSLCEAEMFGVNDERAASWKARRDEVLDEIEKLSNKTRGVGSIRINGFTP